MEFPVNRWRILKRHFQRIHWKIHGRIFEEISQYWRYMLLKIILKEIPGGILEIFSLRLIWCDSREIPKRTLGEICLEILRETSWATLGEIARGIEWGMLRRIAGVILLSNFRFFSAILLIETVDLLIYFWRLFLSISRYRNTWINLS